MFQPFNSIPDSPSRSVALFLLFAGLGRVHLLPSFAATYPVDFFSLLDCAMHSRLTQLETEAAVNRLHAGIWACRESPAVLQQPGAVLALAGAVTSIVKACKLQCAELEAESAGMHGAAAAGKLAGLQLAVLPVVRVLAELAALLPQAATGASAPGRSGSSSSSRSAGRTSSGSGGATAAPTTSGDYTEQQQHDKQHQTATQVLLAVLLARSLVALADVADPSAALRAVLQDASDCSAAALDAADGSSSSSSSHMQQGATEAAAVDELRSALDDWRCSVVVIMNTAYPTFRLLGLGTAKQPQAQCTAADNCHCGSSDSSGRVRWAYLLQLARSKKLAAAFDEMVRPLTWRRFWR
jgi:hypothetical protein